MSWIVAMTKPNFEGLASERLAQQGFVSYCPRYLQKRPGLPDRHAPLFPRYLFVLIDQAWYCITGTRGISKVLLGNDGPAILPTSVIDDLKRREIKGLVQLGKMPKYQPGQRVKAKSGPLQDHLLIYDDMTSHDRVRVLVNLLGRACKVELEEKTLIAA
jgi:transcription antitermination factor NusG